MTENILHEIKNGDYTHHVKMDLKKSPFPGKKLSKPHSRDPKGPEKNSLEILQGRIFLLPGSTGT